MHAFANKATVILTHIICFSYIATYCNCVSDLKQIELFWESNCTIIQSRLKIKKIS